MNSEIDKVTARQILDQYLAKLQVGRPYTLGVFEGLTREESFGWVFFYNSTRFIETGDLRWALAGNAPVIIDRRGRLHVTGTAYAPEHYIEEFGRKYPG